jgi:hypothetical protein
MHPEMMTDRPPPLYDILYDILPEDEDKSYVFSTCTQLVHKAWQMIPNNAEEKIEEIQSSLNTLENEINKKYPCFYFLIFRQAVKQARSSVSILGSVYKGGEIPDNLAHIFDPIECLSPEWFMAAHNKANDDLRGIAETLGPWCSSCRAFNNEEANENEGAPLPLADYNGIRYDFRIASQEAIAFDYFLQRQYEKLPRKIKRKALKRSSREAVQCKTERKTSEKSARRRNKRLRNKKHR